MLVPVLKPNSSLWTITRSGQGNQGAIPLILSGAYTNQALAQAAIDAYEASKPPVKAAPKKPKKED